MPREQATECNIGCLGKWFIKCPKELLTFYLKITFFSTTTFFFSSSLDLIVAPRFKTWRAFTSL